MWSSTRAVRCASTARITDAEALRCLTVAVAAIRLQGQVIFSSLSITSLYEPFCVKRNLQCFFAVGGGFYVIVAGHSSSGHIQFGMDDSKPL
jgi:hypothetical protein